MRAAMAMAPSGRSRRTQFPGEAGAVGDGQRRAGDDSSEDQGAGGERAVGECGVGRLLGDEAEQQWHPGHRRRADDGHGLRRQPAGEQRRERPNVPRAGLVVDDADDHERSRLEQSMGDEQDDPRLRRRRRAGTEQHDEKAELADSAVGEEQLEVVLAQRTQPAGDHREEPDTEHERSPRRCQGEHRGESAEHVDPGLDHRGRVQVGAHRASAQPSLPVATSGTGTAPTS